MKVEYFLKYSTWQYSSWVFGKILNLSWPGGQVLVVVFEISQYLNTYILRILYKTHTTARTLIIEYFGTKKLIMLYWIRNICIHAIQFKDRLYQVDRFLAIWVGNGITIFQQLCNGCITYLLHFDPSDTTKATPVKWNLHNFSIGHHIPVYNFTNFFLLPMSGLPTLYQEVKKIV